MLELNDFSSIRLSLASPEQIKIWSYGEVTKPETINYRTLKPEKDGLFCERIFGPTKDFECYCGKYKKVRNKGVICDKCGVEVAHSSVRRERMGHIQLAAPVAHIWFVKVTPTRLGLLLDLSPRKLEQVIYFAKFVITHVDETARQQAMNALKDEMEYDQLQEEESVAETPETTGELADVESVDDETTEAANGVSKKQQAKAEEQRARHQEEILLKMKELEEIQPLKLLGVNEYRELKSRWGHLFQAGMGAEAILEILQRLDLNELREALYEEVASTSGQHQKKALKRLRVIEAFMKQGTKPEWMIMTVLPVIPPELRPMVQLDGGRFATSDLNDLYRRVINRNNRLKRLMEIGTPDVIIRNEKRMLQEAVDSLIDNGRRGKPVTTSNGHKLKSLSDMLRGKQGHFRQNLLGKRVDYSGRSVIVAGPELKLHQCGLPKRMALELFKPFVMRRLIARGLAYNIRSAKRAVEQGKPEVWEILEEVVSNHPIMLNRAPTLHRLSMQAFMPVLIDSSAIQLHPLVCAAFNADFDGDQMAVHIPLSRAAVEEAKGVMLSTYNMLLPSSGEPVVAPTLEMVLGCYYVTSIREEAKGEGMTFADFDDAKLAYDLGIIELGAEIKVRDPKGKMLQTTPGRIIFNDALPDELGFRNEVMAKRSLKQLTSECYHRFGGEVTAEMLDKIKRLGFKYATTSGKTLAVSDLEIPPDKDDIIAKADAKVSTIVDQFQEGLITEDERYLSTVKTWIDATDEITTSLENNLDRYGSIYMMANSGARGNIGQIRQMAGMRGLMSGPSGQIIELPIKANFREGLSVLEYFISTHGARKGLADTALRTSDSGYLTRRLIDVAQEIIVCEEDCGTEEGLWISAKTTGKDTLPPLADRIVGRMAARPVTHPESGDVLVSRNEIIGTEKASQIAEAGVTEVCVRSPILCQTRGGICQSCYGIDLARGHIVESDVAVGIIAAQSIGEPGTQLTMRTFHTGGVVGLDITSGLPRVEELVEARIPKGQGIISEIDGIAEITESGEGWKVKISSTRTYRDDYPLPPGHDIVVEDGQMIDAGQILAFPIIDETAEDGSEELVSPPILAGIGGKVEIHENKVSILHEETEECENFVHPTASLLVENGQQVNAGDQLTEGPLNPQDIMRIMGMEAVQRYLVDEVQKVYRAQGVTIHDKHIEVIVSRMLRKVRVDSPGDTRVLPGELMDRFDYADLNAKILAEGGEPATAHPILLGITRASLNTTSFLAAASFQETTRVLTEAAIVGSVDRLVGLKENVIIGKLIPARSKISREQFEQYQASLGKPAMLATVTDEEGESADWAEGEAAPEPSLEAELETELEIPPAPIIDLTD